MIITPECETVYLPYSQELVVWDQILSGNHFLKTHFLGRDYFISTLPKIHELELKQIEFELKSFCHNHQFSFDNIDFNKPFFNTTKVSDRLFIHPEFLFVLETLLLGYIHHNISPQNLTAPKINGLFDKKRDITEYKNEECLKIKIRTTDDFKLLNTKLCALLELNPQMLFRLDGNRSFSLLKLLELESELDPKVKKQIDYIEEPFHNFYDNVSFRNQSGLKLAMDENFTHFLKLEEKKKALQDFAIVIKPSLFGLSNIHNFLTKTQQSDITISSTYEHESMLIGHYFLANKTLNKYHGLGLFVL